MIRIKERKKLEGKKSSFFFPKAITAAERGGNIIIEVKLAKKFSQIRSRLASMESGLRATRAEKPFATQHVQTTLR